ncbi:MAG TPA: hypothetical protein VGO47_14165 [Chlamydiales bacterium]|jgi:hypothetical protein|nr:hypothetical protein [Chlamydiales bacterium]
MAYPQIEAEERLILEQVADALATVQTEEIPSIPEIDAKGRKAIGGIDYAIPGPPQKMSNDITSMPASDASPEALKVQHTATRLISKHSVESPINLFSKRAARNAPVENASASKEQYGEQLLEETKELLDNRNIPENLPDFSHLDPKELVAKSIELEEQAEDALDAASVANIVLEKAIAKRKFPNVAKEILMLGLEIEKRKTAELEHYKKESDTHRAQIRKLLDLSELLEALPTDQPTHNLQTAILDKLASPKKEEMEACIKEVFHHGSFDITKAQLAGGNARINEMMSEHKTAMTNLMTNNISLVVHVLQTLVQILQNTLRLDERLNDKIISHTGGR